MVQTILKRSVLMVMFVFLAACSPAPAEPPTQAAVVSEELCPQIVAQALEATDRECTGTERNQICYGNVQLAVTPQAGVENFQFAQPGDIVDITELQSLHLSSMNTTTQEWGVALMQVQASLPDSLPGQNVTILLFGNVEIENATAEDGQLAFYFQSGVGDAPCAEAPDSGILVQTPEGVGQVTFRVNEVDIQLGSTAYFQAQSGADMDISVVEGAAVVSAQGVTQTVYAGLLTGVPLDANNKPSGPPSPPVPYTATHLQTLPVTHLRRPVGISTILASSTFATDAEGWTMQGDGSELAHNAADTTSDGYVCSVDTSQGEDWLYQAPESWLGDRSTAYGGSLSFVIRQSAEGDQYDSDDVLLTGGGITLKYNTAENPGLDWTAYNVPLVETGWINATTGAQPTRDEMMTVLSALTEIAIRGEYRQGDDTGCLDYAQLTGIIVPTVGGQVVQPTQAVAAAPTQITTSGTQIGFEISDSISVAGEQDTYTFTADRGKVVYFDAFGPSSAIRWTVTDETGEDVFRDYWLDRDAGLFTLEHGGTYTLTVYGNQDATGDYAFKLWDVPPPQTFETAIGEIVSDTAPGNGTGNIEVVGAKDIYTFEAEAGQQVYFDASGPSSAVRWTVTDEAGEDVFRDYWLDRDAGLFTLERGGTYTITAYGNQDSTGVYRFQLYDVPLPQTFTTQIGEIVSDTAPGNGTGNIEVVGAKDIYTFVAEAGQQVYFDASGPSSAIRWTVTDEAGTEIFRDYWLDRDAGLFTLERGGTYTITAYGNQDSTGVYRFELYDVPLPQTFTTQIGDAASENVPAEGAGNIELPGAKDIYTFEAEAGQQVYFDASGPSSNIRWTVTDESGTDVFRDYWLDRDAGLFTLERGGIYTITAYGNQDSTSVYRFELYDVPSPQTFSTNIGDTVSENTPGEGAGHIESPGVQDIYTFTAEAGQQVYFDGQGQDANLRWTVTDEAGTDVFNDYWLDRDAGLFTLELGGTYTVTAYGNQDTTGVYRFQLYDVPAPQTFNINVGDTVSEGAPGEGAGNIESPGVQDIYTFTAQPGQIVDFVGQGQDANIRWTVTDETGTEIFGDYWLDRDAGIFTLQQGGTYTITVYGNQDTIGTYRFQLVRQ